MRSTRRSTRFAAVAAAAALMLAACGDDNGDVEPETPDDGMDEGMDDDAMDDGMDDDAMDDGMDDDGMDDGMDDDQAAGAEFGEACAAIPEEGPGSSEDMAAEPAATAASTNPLLTTLVDLVGQVDLVDTLNGLDGATIFAPTDDAFLALQESDPDLFDTVANDPDLLAAVLTYHVIGDEELDADGLIEAGEATTVSEGQEPLSFVEGGVEGVQVEAAGNTVDVICGNVATANATVHIIDQVLLPDVG